MSASNGQKDISLTIDGVEVSVPAGTNVVDAAKAVAVEVPIFCHHPRLEPVGMCRMCLVEVGMPDVDRATGEINRDEDGHPIIRFFPKLQVGCTTRVSEGMVVRTATPEVGAARFSVLEFLLTSHPLDCPVCDKGGECPLQNLTMRYGPGRSRFALGDKYQFPKPVPIGPLIVLDRERCVLCARCIRFQDEIADDHVLGFENRGRGMEIVSYSDPPFASYFSGNTSDICPVGALTTTDFRFRGRVWELVPVPGICSHCPVGCNISRDTRNGEILRVMPDRNEAVNEIWLCDKGRFGHHLPGPDARITTPLIRKEGALQPASWDAALGLIAERLRGIVAADGPDAIGAIAGDGLCNEDLYLIGRFMRGVIGTNSVDHRPGIVRDDIIARAGVGADTRPTAIGAGTTVMVVGADVEEEAPVLFLNLFKALSQGAEIVVIGGQPQKLDRHSLASLRYRHGSAERVLTVLIAQVLERLEAGPDGPRPIDPALADARAALRADLAGYDAAWLEGEHPIHAGDLEAAARSVADAEHVIIMYGREAEALGLVPALGALAASLGRAGGADDGLVAIGPHANSQGAADMGVLPDLLPGYRKADDTQAHEALGAAGWRGVRSKGGGMDTAAMLTPDSGLRALLVFGTDPVGDEPAREPAAKALELLVVSELAETATTRMADVVLPAAAFAERDGTVTNMFRRVQRTRAAEPVPGDARPDWWMVAELARRMGVAEAFAGPEDVMAEIARAIPEYAGIDYAALGPEAPSRPADPFLPFAPSTEARYVSYEGTSYDSAAGTGIVWPTDGRAVADRLLPLLDWRPRAEERGEESPQGAVQGRMTLVPVTRLYDAGADMVNSSVLIPLIPAPHVVMSPFDAAARGLSEGARVTVGGLRGSLQAEVRLVDGLTPGVVLAPRSLAWNIPPDALTGDDATADVVVERDAPPHAGLGSNQAQAPGNAPDGLDEQTGAERGEG